MTQSLEERFGIRGKVALVTGGAMGIGREVCLTLAQAGATVAVQDLDASGADSVAGEIRKHGGQAIAIPGDVSKPTVIETMLERSRGELGGLDILVNNAGIYPLTFFLDMSVEDWDRVQSVNLRATFLATKLAGGWMAEAGVKGRIINLSSVQGFRPTGPGMAHYDVTKAGIVMLTKAAALELAQYEITVNAVAPGMVQTPGTRMFWEGGILGEPAERVPLGRWGTPEDIANAILYLASPAASYVTGETILVDGGFLLR